MSQCASTYVSEFRPGQLNTQRALALDMMISHAPRVISLLPMILLAMTQGFNESDWGSFANPDIYILMRYHSDIECGILLLRYGFLADMSGIRIGKALLIDRLAEIVLGRRYTYGSTSVEAKPKARHGPLRKPYSEDI